MATRKLIKLRRDDACTNCERPIPAGTEAYWLKPERRVMCRPCGDVSGSPESIPGASARREYERKRQARIDKARFGRIGTWVAEHSEGPQHERAWAQGAAGEQRNALRLEKLVGDHPVAFLHDRGVPGSRANIDHIAIAPSGVFVIDSKNVRGQVKIDWKGGLFSERRWFLYVGGRDRTSWVEGVEKQVDVVLGVLNAAGYEGIPVHGALCMTNGEGLPWIGHPQLRQVPICRPRNIAKRLRADGPGTAESIRELHAVLERSLRAA